MGQPYNYFFKKLSEAIAKGYTADFSLLINGTVKCHSIPNKCYLLEEVIIEAVDCIAAGVRLLLISTIDGKEKGIAFDALRDYES